MSWSSASQSPSGDWPAAGRMDRHPDDTCHCRPLEQLNGVMAKIAQGLFNSRIAIERDDEIGIALRNVQAMQAKLGFDREVNPLDEALRRSSARGAGQQLTQAISKLRSYNSSELVASASTELAGPTASSLTATAEDASSLATAVARRPKKPPPTCKPSLPPPRNWPAPSAQRSAGRCSNRPRDGAGGRLRGPHQHQRSGAYSMTPARIGDVIELINTSPDRPTCWRSMPPSKRRAPARLAAARCGGGGSEGLAKQTAKATVRSASRLLDPDCVQELVSAIRGISATIDETERDRLRLPALWKNRARRRRRLPATSSKRRSAPAKSQRTSPAFSKPPAIPALPLIRYSQASSELSRQSETMRGQVEILPKQHQGRLIELAAEFRRDDGCDAVADNIGSRSRST